MNYNKTNLIPVDPATVPAQTPAVKIGNDYFLAGKNSGGGGDAAFDLVKVTGHTTTHEAYSAITQIVVSGLVAPTEEWEPDFSAFNGTYLPTADTAAETDPLKRIYKHSTENKWIKHYVFDPEESGEGTGFWLMVTNLSQGLWDASLSKDSYNQPLVSGTGRWENMDYGMTQSATLAVTTTNYPAVAFSLTAEKITGYTDADYMRTYTTDNITMNLSGSDYTPVVGGMDILDNANLRLIIHVSDTTQRGVTGMVFYAPLSAAAETAVTGQALTTTGTITYQTEGGIQCAYFNGNSYIQTSDRRELTPIIESNSFTISVWAKISTTGSYEGVVMGGYQGPPYGLVFGGRYLGYQIGGARETYADYSAYYNRWAHLCLIADNGTITLYINGTQAGSAHTYSSIQYYSDNLTIGAWNFGKLTGYLASVRIMDRAITAQELATLAAEYTPTA